MSLIYTIIFNLFIISITLYFLYVFKLHYKKIKKIIVVIFALYVFSSMNGIILVGINCYIHFTRSVEQNQLKKSLIFPSVNHTPSY